MLAVLSVYLGDSGGDLNPVERLVSYGALGLVLLAVVTGYLVAKPSVDRLLADKAAAEARRDQLIDVYQREVIPALIEFNRVATSLLPLLQRLVEKELGRGTT